MRIALIVFSILAGLELLLWWRPLWSWHGRLASALLVPLVPLNLFLLIYRPRFWVVVLVLLSLYRVINLLRLVKNRVQPDYLYNSSRKTCWWLVGLQGVDLALAKLGSYYHTNPLAWFYLLALAQTITGLFLLAETLRHLRATRPPNLKSVRPDRDLPSLTVAIPARNETTDLEACLQSLITSDYPKLEILVLDDCSQNKRTPEIIRAFAHSGVRFIAGKTPPSQWLAKNYAYSQLAEEASGELLLFCGVDTRFGIHSLRAMVEVSLQSKKTMLSIIPQNSLSSGLKPMLIQPGRYAWELAIPRRLFGRQPVLSTCWLITRQALAEAGAFAAASRKAIPESYLARQAAASGNGYGFVQADKDMGIVSSKSFAEQLATGIRTRYPQLHRRPELVALVGFAEFMALLMPLVVLIATLCGRLWPLAALAAIAYLAEAITYSKIVNLTYRKFLLRGTWFLPIAAVYDIAILNYSMWQYEFREVIWKGRNVCIPVMRVAD